MESEVGEVIDPGYERTDGRAPMYIFIADRETMDPG
jgi:hypothetical protein